MNKQKIIEVAWFIVVISLFILSIFLIKSGVLQEKLASFGIWTPVVLVILKISTLVIAPLGGTPLYVLAGSLFGVWQGFLLCFLGDILGSIISFIIGRYYGERVVKFFVGDSLFKKIFRFVGLLGDSRSFIKARLAAISMPEILAYAAGLSPINFWKFLVLHMPLYVVSDGVLVFFGSQIGDLTSKYSYFAFSLVILVSITSVFMLYKDYQKVEGM